MENKFKEVLGKNVNQMKQIIKRKKPFNSYIRNLIKIKRKIGKQEK